MRIGNRVGDLVQYAGDPHESKGRSTGIVLGWDMYHPDSCERSIPIVEVLWGKHSGWIQLARVTFIDENR